MRWNTIFNRGFLWVCVGLVIFSGFWLTPVRVYAAIINVNGIGDNTILLLAGNGTCDLREAIQAANTNLAVDGCPAGAGGDIITFDPVVFAAVQTINLAAGELGVSSDITFTGPAVGVIVNQNLANNRVFNMSNGPVTMTNMIVQGGSINANGSGILINNVGGVATNYRFGAGVVIQNNNNVGAAAFGGGIAAFNNAQVFLENGAQVINNRARSGAGIFTNFKADLFINGATISGNTATIQGGGVRVSGTGPLPSDPSVATVTFTNATITGNTAQSGGGVYFYGPSTVTITDGSISNNTTSAVFGGIAAEGSLDNSSGQLIGAPTVTVTGTTISDNTGALGGGGGGATVGAAVTLTNVTVSGNRTTTSSGTFGNGGGFSVSNTGTNNGAWSVASSLTINGTTTFNLNTAVRDGGGVYINGLGSSVTTTSGTFTSNSATRNGGAMAVDADGVITVSGARVQSNTAAAGGAFFQVGASSTSTVNSSCIVCNSDNAIDYSGGTLPMNFSGNWWGSTYGPYYLTSTDGLQCSTGDSLNSGNPLAQYGISVTTPSDAQCNFAPTGNWSVTPLATCTGAEIGMASSLSPTRICPRSP